MGKTAKKASNVKPQQPRKPKTKSKTSHANKQVAASAAYASGQTTGQARISRTSADSCRIVHRELIASVTGSVAFTVAQSFPLNPGMPVTFPWLSNEAAGWERYRFNKLRFCYYTRTGSNVPGSVMLSPDYDPADPAPIGEQIASSYQDAQEDAPWKDIHCELMARELMGDMKEKTIRNGALAANQDIKTYDAGNLHLCTVDGTAVSWGKLWVEYDVTLYTPQVPAGGFNSNGTLASGGGSIAAATPFGAVPVATGSVVLAAAATNVVSLSNLQIGSKILISAWVQGTVISAASIATVTGLTAVNAGAIFNAAATSAMAFGTFTVTAAAPTATLSITSTTVTSTWYSVSVLSPGPAF